jgi:hypothetical protein
VEKTELGLAEKKEKKELGREGRAEPGPGEKALLPGQAPAGPARSGR